MIQLRRTESLDLVDDLNDRIFPGERLLRNEAERCLWWTLTDDETPVGFCGLKELRREPGAWFLKRAGVIESHRGRGYQRRMIRRRVRYAFERGASKVVTYTLNSNPASSNNLIRCGFRLYVPAESWAGFGALYWMREAPSSTGG